MIILAYTLDSVVLSMLVLMPDSILSSYDTLSIVSERAAHEKSKKERPATIITYRPALLFVHVRGIYIIFIDNRFSVPANYNSFYTIIFMASLSFTLSILKITTY